MISKVAKKSAFQYCRGKRPRHSYFRVLISPRLPDEIATYYISIFLQETSNILINADFYRGRECFLRPAMSAANRSRPTALIRSTQALRLERKMKPNTLDTRLLNFLHALTSAKSLHSAQLESACPMLHFLIAHQPAFSFFSQPGHFPRMYFPHAPQ
jgi:hypothetical protein